MLTKKKHIGSAHAFRDVPNWPAILGIGGLIVFVMILLGSG